MKIKTILLSSLISITAATTMLSVSPVSEQATAESVGDTDLTIDSASIIAFNQGFDSYYHRIAISITNKEGITIDNTGTRYGSATNFPTILINGNSYTFDNVANNGTLNGYIAMFCQTMSPWTMYFMREPGSSVEKNNKNSGWYSKSWPGIPANEDTYITFPKDTCIGRYKFTNEFTFYLNKEQTKFSFITNPKELNITGGTTNDSYPYLGKNMANGGKSNITITPNFVEGKTAYALKITDKDSNELNLAVTKNSNGTFTFPMPDEDINVEVLFKEVTYKLTLGDNNVEVTPFKPIGTLPSGRWAIDGLEISDESIYIWNEDKVAVRVEEQPNPIKTYTLSLFVDNTLYTKIYFNENSEKVVLPPVPYKDGYRIVGWDVTEIKLEDMDIHALYERQ